MNRRNFFALAGAAAPAATSALAAARLDQLPVRKIGKVEVVFDSPATKPNGLQATKEGLWIIDQGAGNQAKGQRHHFARFLDRNACANLGAWLFF